jgi:hypothetical protein
MGMMDRDQLIVFSPDGTWLFHERADRVQIWHVPSGRLQDTVPGRFVGLSLDGTICLTWTGTTAQAWHLPSGHMLALTDLTADQFADHQRLWLDARRGSRSLTVHDLFAPDQPETITFFDEYIESPLQKTPLDPFVLCHLWYDIGIAETTRLVCLDLTTGQPVTSWGQARYHRLCYSSAHCIIMLVTGGQTIDCCDLVQRERDIQENTALGKTYPDLCAGEFLVTVNGLARTDQVRAVSINPHDRDHLAVAVDATLQLVRIEAGETGYRRTADGITQVVRPGPIAAVEFYPDGARIACMLETGELSLHRADTGKLITVLTAT